MTLEFHCKDPLMVKHYDETFRLLFEDHLSWMPAGDLSALYRFMDECMLAEARLQEHYEYTEDEQGRRTPVLDSDGEKKLLIPTINLFTDDHKWLH